MKDALWKPLLTELDRWKKAGITSRLWLRDDDATEPSPALDRFAELTGEFRIPAVLAIIPAKTGRSIVWAFLSQQASMQCKLVSATYIPWYALCP